METRHTLRSNYFDSIGFESFSSRSTDLFEDVDGFHIQFQLKSLDAIHGSDLKTTKRKQSVDHSREGQRDPYGSLSNARTDGSSPPDRKMFTRICWISVEMQVGHCPLKSVGYSSPVDSSYSTRPKPYTSHCSNVCNEAQDHAVVAIDLLTWTCLLVA